MDYVWLSEWRRLFPYTVLISFVMETCCVFFEVRPEFLNVMYIKQDGAKVPNCFCNDLNSSIPPAVVKLVTVSKYINQNLVRHWPRNNE